MRRWLIILALVLGIPAILGATTYLNYGSAVRFLAGEVWFGDSDTAADIKLSDGSTNTASLGTQALSSNTTWDFPAAPAGDNYLLNADADGTMGSIDPKSYRAVMYSAYSESSVTSGDETTFVFASSGGSKAIPANEIAAGRAYHVRLSGVHSVNVASVAQTYTFALKFGTTTLASVTTATLTPNKTDLDWTLDATITGWTTGATGSVNIHGTLTYDDGSKTLVYFLPNAGSRDTVDTTASNTINVSVDLAQYNSGDEVACREFLVERLN